MTASLRRLVPLLPLLLAAAAPQPGAAAGKYRARRSGAAGRGPAAAPCGVRAGHPGRAACRGGRQRESALFLLYCVNEPFAVGVRVLRDSASLGFSLRYFSKIEIIISFCMPRPR